MKKVGVVSLGCSRNLVDSEVISGSLRKHGFKIGELREDLDICVINTCAFIEAARKESIDVILEVAQLKKAGRIKRIVICGCLPQLFKGRLSDELPEADLIVGTSDFPKLPGLIKKLLREKTAPPPSGGRRRRDGGIGRCAVSNEMNYLYNDHSPRFLLTPSHYAYVKVSEGCSNFCSYCIIPRLRGTFRSRSVRSVIEEVKKLSADGTLKEINLIGQDTTLFGVDRYGKTAFPELLKRMCAVDTAFRWVRILYTHPAHYTDKLIATVRGEERICKYLDLPIQHISDKILKRMNRHVAKRDVIRLIERLRRDIPGVVLRTSIIVGFPGETEKDFKELLDFVREIRFERLGAFVYSREDRTRASRFSGQVPEAVKKERLDELMKLQQRVSSSLNGAYLGKTVKVLIDEKLDGEDSRFLGRTQGDAPEVDGTVYVAGKKIEIGRFYDVRITDTLEYDLVGEKI